MNIVMVASECAPFSKTGGLGDVVQSLPKALAARGHRVMVVVPRYREYEEVQHSHVVPAQSGVVRDTTYYDVQAREEITKPQLVALVGDSVRDALRKTSFNDSYENSRPGSLPCV